MDSSSSHLLKYHSPYDSKNGLRKDYLRQRIISGLYQSRLDKKIQIKVLIILFMIEISIKKRWKDNI
jgi:hypothetical protein